MHANEAIRFPLAEVIHFPNARQALELLPRPLHGFPTAPWAAALGEGVAQRASGDAAKVRVAALTSRFFFDLDFVLVIDTDEFVQLFDYDDDHDDIPSHDHDEDDEGHERHDQQQRLMRVDVKTFIARHEALIRRHGQVRMWRPHVRRSAPNGQAEPRLAELLAQLAGLDGNATLGALQGMPDFKAADAEGKSLFSLAAALNPYLHFNQGWPYPPADHARGFMLHIREPFKNGKSVNGSSYSRRWSRRPLPAGVCKTMMTYKSFIEVWLSTYASLPVPPAHTGEEIRGTRGWWRNSAGCIKLKSRDVCYVSSVPASAPLQMAMQVACQVWDAGWWPWRRTEGLHNMAIALKQAFDARGRDERERRLPCALFI